jgi:hypothetical protein
MDAEHGSLETDSPSDQLSSGLCVTLAGRQRFRKNQRFTRMSRHEWRYFARKKILMNEKQQTEASIEKVSFEKQPWTEAWEQAWEAYQGQQKPEGDEKPASFPNRAKQEDDARYLGEKYFKEVYQYLPKAQCPPTE